MKRPGLRSILPRLLPALAVCVLASAPSYGQQPATCTAPSWSVGEPTTPSDKPDGREGPFGGKLYTQTSSAGTFEGEFKARAADASGLGILACLVRGNCGFGDLLAWIFEVAGWAGFSKAELTRTVSLAPRGPQGADARVRLEGSLEGLLAVSSFGLSASNAKVTADVWANPGGEGTLTVLHEERTDDSVLDQGAYFTPVSTTLSQMVTVAIGEQLFLEGHLRAESNSARIPDLGAALGAAQFHEAVGGGFFDLLNPPISIPDPGLKMRATIVNVSPVLAVNQPTVSVDLGEEATNSGTLCDGDADPVTLTASIGTVTNHRNGTWSWSLPAGEAFHGRTVTITADDGEVTRRKTFQLVPSVRIDIRPKTTNDSIDLRSDGHVKVAVLAGAHFDPVSQVQQPSLRFGRMGGEDSLVRVGAGTTQKLACGMGDVNDDGLSDLVCSFQIPRMGFECGDRVGVLTAGVPVFDSSPVEGRSDVVLVPCNTIRTPAVIYEDPVLSSGYSGVAASPDGAALYIGSGDAILALSGGGGPPVQINTGDLGFVIGLTVSHDGSTVFASLSHGELAATNPVVVSVPAGGGPATVLANLPADSLPGGLAVSPDGTRLFISAGQDSLLSVPSVGGIPVNVLLGGGFGVVKDVDVAASGATLYMGADGTDQVLTMPATGGIPTYVSTGVAFADPVNIALSPDKTTLFVLDPNIRIDASGGVVTSGGWAGAVFMGPSMGGRYVPLVVGGADFNLTGRIDVSPDGSALYFSGTRRSTGTPVVLSVDTGLNR